LESEASSPSNLRDHLFCAFQAERPLADPWAYDLTEIDEVLIGRGEPSVQRQGSDGVRRLVVRVRDSRMSSAHARLRRHGGTFELEDLGSKNGSVVGWMARRAAHLQDGDCIELGWTYFFFRRLPPLPDASPLLLADGTVPGLKTLLPPLAASLRTYKGAAAESTIPLLILGESGSGKELLAQAAHQLSRRGGPLVPVNCAALAEGVVAAELFGFRKGAFSGALEDRTGLVRSADHGTLFLDEIAELSGAAQAALLRTIQEREVLPVGATRPVAVDVRLVCATHRDLHAAVEAGSFRGDLLARIDGYTMRLPPLRERREDLGLLVASLLRRLAGDKAERVSFTGRAARRLLQHRWRFNVRELQMCLAAALVSADGVIDAEHLKLQPESLSSSSPRVGLLPAQPAPAETPPQSPLPLPSKEENRSLLQELMSKHNGSIHAVARELGKDRVQIRRWVKAYGIDVHQFRSKPQSS
jgi:transcriptional regulator with AAA-type ATPase domain